MKDESANPGGPAVGATSALGLPCARGPLSIPSSSFASATRMAAVSSPCATAARGSEPRRRVPEFRSGSAGLPSCQGVAAKCSASSAATWSAACSGSQCEAPSSSVKR